MLDLKCYLANCLYKTVIIMMMFIYQLNCLLLKSSNFYLEWYWMTTIKTINTFTHISEVLI